MLKFTIFGIPVSVEPWFWLMGFMLGGGISHLQNGSMMYVAAWLVLLFGSILVHELGHALVGHKLGGGRTWIVLHAFGGLAFHQAARFSPRDRRLMILAGPGAGLCLFVLTCILMLIIWPGETGRQLLALAIGLSPEVVNNEVYDIFQYEHIKFYIFKQMIWINLWWSLVNLLPIYPLDGGQLADTYIKSRKKLYLTGMICSGLVILLGYSYTQSIFIVLMFAYFGFQNYQAYEKANY